MTTMTTACHIGQCHDNNGHPNTQDDKASHDKVVHHKHRDVQDNKHGGCNITTRTRPHGMEFGHMPHTSMHTGLQHVCVQCVHM